MRDSYPSFRIEVLWNFALLSSFNEHSPKESLTNTRSPTMKTLISRLVIAAVIASFAGVAAFAKTKTETFTLESNVKFNGTVINKGVYKVKFDDQTGEITIADRSGKVVARATGSLEKRDQKARQFMLRTIAAGEDTELIGVTFGGSESDVMVSGSAARRQ